MGKTLGLPLVMRTVTRREADFLKVPRSSMIRFDFDNNEGTGPTIYISKVKELLSNPAIEGIGSGNLKFAGLMGLWFKTEADAKKATGVK